eukprot:scaffold154_cov185-Alexandrium_tamarense.AAC.6
MQTNGARVVAHDIIRQPRQTNATQRRFITLQSSPRKPLGWCNRKRRFVGGGRQVSGRAGREEVELLTLFV